MVEAEEKPDETPEEPPLETGNEPARTSGKPPLTAGAGAADEDDAADDEDGGEEFLPGEGVEADPDADGGGEDGLEVGVHADQGRAQAFLSERNQEVGNEGGEEDQVADFPADASRDGGEVGLQETPEREGQGQEQREEEHPLHEGHHVVLADQRAEKAQVQREAQAVDQQEHDTQRGRMVHTAGMDGVVDQVQHAGETERHATGFLPGNRLTQKEKGEEHGEDRA